MKSKAFRFLWIGQAFANAGDILYVVALIATVYDLTHSAFYMAFVPFFVTFARFISSVLAPFFLDRYQLKALLFHSQAAKTILLFLMFVFMMMHIKEVWILLLAASCISFLDGWALPAQNALVPLLVKREELLGTNGFLSTIDHLIGFGGWSMGGLLTALISPKGTMGVTFVLFVLSTLFMSKIAIEKHPEHKQPVEVKTRQYIRSLSAGWIEIWKHDILRKIHIMYWLESAAGVVWIAAIMYIFVEKQLHTGEEWWGLINGAFFVGLILASVLVLKFHLKVTKQQGIILFFGSFFTAAVTMLFGLNQIPVLALVLSVLFGLFDQSKAMILQTMVQRETDPEQLPKVYAAQNALVTITFGGASLLVGWFVQHYGVRSAFLVSSILLFISVIPSGYVARKLKH